MNELPPVDCDAWANVAYFCFREWLRRPWRRVRWRAFVEALEYAAQPDPPPEWPDGLPTVKPNW